MTTAAAKLKLRSQINDSCVIGSRTIKNYWRNGKVVNRNQGQKQVRIKLVRSIRNVSILGASLFLIAAGCSPVMGFSEEDGISLFQQQKYDEAASCLVTNLKDQPENPAFNFYMGRSLLALNQSV